MRKRANEARLEDLEGEFLPLLKSCLEECARGRWGLFDQIEDPVWRRHMEWTEAILLKEMAAEIIELRSEFGIRNPLVERFLYYCSLKGQNVPGEPKLAATFLEEIKTNQHGTQP
jgi:hypothetical protein